MPLIDHFHNGLRAASYYQTSSNDYYCEVGQDDEDHRHRRQEITETFWRIENSYLGPSFICDNCYRELIEFENGGIRRRPKLGNRVLIRRNLPGCCDAD